MANALHALIGEYGRPEDYHYIVYFKLGFFNKNLTPEQELVIKDMKLDFEKMKTAHKNLLENISNFGCE